MAEQKSVFTKEVQSKAHLRQGGLCALCGVSITWDNDEAIPVVPPRPHDTGDATWKREIDNCVILCKGCAMWAVVDDSSPSALHDADEYAFSHGRSKNGGHKEWATRMMGR